MLASLTLGESITRQWAKDWAPLLFGFVATTVIVGGLIMLVYAGAREVGALFFGAPRPTPRHWKIAWALALFFGQAAMLGLLAMLWHENGFDDTTG